MGRLGQNMSNKKAHVHKCMEQGWCAESKKVTAASHKAQVYKAEVTLEGSKGRL